MLYASSLPSVRLIRRIHLGSTKFFPCIPIGPKNIFHAKKKQTILIDCKLHTIIKTYVQTSHCRLYSMYYAMQKWTKFIILGKKSWKCSYTTFVLRRFPWKQRTSQSYLNCFPMANRFYQHFNLNNTCYTKWIRFAVKKLSWGP